jgi:hypothetical protein
VLDWILTQNNPVIYIDPDGNSPYSALSLVREHRETIHKYAAQHGVNPQAIASIIFQEKFHGYGAAVKNIPAAIDAIGNFSAVANERSIGLAEMQVLRAGELLDLDISQPEARKRVLAALGNPDSAIDLIARNIADYQTLVGRPLSVEEATIAHNASGKGLMSFLMGEVPVDQRISEGKVYTRSWGYQPAIGFALEGQIIPIPDNPSTFGCHPPY